MLDLYKKNGNKYTHVMSISESDFAHLQYSFNIFHKLTGYKIDEYGDTVIVNSAIDILNDVLKTESTDSRITEKYIKLFEKIKEESGDLIFIGD